MPSAEFNQREPCPTILASATHSSHSVPLVRHLQSIMVDGALPVLNTQVSYHLHGRSYHLWVPPSEAGPARGHTLPSVMLIDRIDHMDEGGLGLLQRWRDMIQAEHPLSRVLAHASDLADETGAAPIAIRVGPSTPISDEMEVALVYPNSDRGPPERYSVYVVTLELDN